MCWRGVIAPSIPNLGDSYVTQREKAPGERARDNLQQEAEKAPEHVCALQTEDE
jgi:hypothetical protein